MIQLNSAISPLAFYDDISLQHHRRDYAFGAVFPLITKSDMLLPFQFCIESGSSIYNVTLHRLNSSVTSDITTKLKERGLSVSVYSDFSLVTYPGKFSVSEINAEGFYYLSITISGSKYYSEVFTSVNDVSKYLCLEYKNSQNFQLTGGMINFDNNFSFKCYLDTQVGKPEYSFEEEATERMGYAFIESQVSKKTFRFTVVVPEYLCDALRIVRLCDTKSVYSRGRNYSLSTFSMEPDWEDQGDLASVEVEFETDTVIANIGGYKTELLGGDFNNDFNNDFKIE